MRLRHPNGRGLLLDDAEANQNTYISRDSSASGFAKLRDCSLISSKAAGECQIYGGSFFSSTITGRTIVAGKPSVRNSVIDCSEVSGTACIDGSALLGSTEICDEPLIRDAILRDAIVYGKPYIWSQCDREFTGRIHEGMWISPPKHINLPWCDLSECIDGKVLLDCRCRTVDYWLRHGPKLAKRWDWSQDQIDVTLETIRREFTQAVKAVA